MSYRHHHRGRRRHHRRHCIYYLFISLRMLIEVSFIRTCPIDSKSALVRVMACCGTASGYLNIFLAIKPLLNQCRPRSMTPYGVTRPQCVNPCSEAIFSGGHKCINYTDIYFLTPGEDLCTESSDHQMHLVPGSGTSHETQINGYSMPMVLCMCT